MELQRKGAIGVQPILIAEIEYRAWTHDGKLRHASYKGLRERQDNAAVYRIDRESYSDDQDETAYCRT
ncbi:hypothetical protein PH547_29565 [Rhizobium sp. CNPSo 3464]|uniref:ATP dependent DNA ligase n=1 Tax=Rhizobium sp. CNPSo 3464 TaxID=3021406 RepID=UPI00254F06F3|nr:hypothetical protein [Rhizobium sp. CNPSo 3464]MDK4743039.1 hypothetical protein [Rhizobium sp. CNPSo 3464]